MKKEIKDNKERRFINIPFKVEKRDGDGEEKKKIVFYPAVFNKWSRDFGGWFREKFDPGCFDGVLDDPETVCLLNHNNDLLLARNKKTMTISVDTEGLTVEFDPPDTTLGNDVVEQIDRGDIESGSITMEVESSLWSESSSDDVEEERTIIKVKKLWDVSLVTTPMYPDTSVAKRSFDNWAKENRSKSEEQSDDKEEAIERSHLEMELEIRKRKY